MTLATIKNQVFTAIAASTTSQVKAWAEQHNLEVDLRSRNGWMTVLNAIAQFAKEQAIATAKAINEADFVELNDKICAKAAEVRDRVMPFARIAWQCLKLVALGFAIAAIYCLRAGQKFRAFVDEFEDTGMGPHHIVWYFAKPVTNRVRGAAARRWFMVREKAIALSAQRKVREATVGAVGGFVMFTSLGLIG